MSKTTPINTFRFSLFCWVLLFAVSFTEGQDRQPQSKTSDHPCHQDRVDREQLIAEAERNEFNVKHVEILGNTYTQGRSFFRIITVNEGDIFTRRNLEIAVKRISKMGSVYPITMDNVRVGLNREDKSIDFVFCVRQKPKR